MQPRRTSLTEDVAGLAQPTDDEWKAYLKAHADTFRVQRQFTANAGYTKGVPIGGDLHEAPSGKSPSFAATKVPYTD